MICDGHVANFQHLTTCFIWLVCLYPTRFLRQLWQLLSYYWYTRTVAEKGNTLSAPIVLTIHTFTTKTNTIYCTSWSWSHLPPLFSPPFSQLYLSKGLTSLSWTPLRMWFHAQYHPPLEMLSTHSWAPSCAWNWHMESSLSETKHLPLLTDLHWLERLPPRSLPWAESPPRLTVSHFPQCNRATSPLESFTQPSWRLPVQVVRSVVRSFQRSSHWLLSVLNHASIDV